MHARRQQAWVPTVAGTALAGQQTNDLAEEERVAVGLAVQVAAQSLAAAGRGERDVAGAVGGREPG
jgi:hypothetical protein